MKKLTKIILGLSISACMSANIFADEKHNVCDGLPGQWSGKAELKYFIFTCKYDSTATVHDGSPYSAEVKFSKTSRNFLCPGSGTQHVDVTCNDSRVSMKDSVIDVEGNLSDDGNSAELEGNFYATYRYHPFKLSVDRD